MIWGYPLGIVIISELLHCIAGLLLLAPVYLTWAGSSRQTGVIILYGLYLFSLAALAHIVLDSLQSVF
jgi:hypothetical protein